VAQVSGSKEVDAARKDGGSGSSKKSEKAVVFRFGLRGDASQDFLAASSDQAVIAVARAQLELPESDRGMHVNGLVGRAKHRSNLDWSWEYMESQWKLAEVSIDSCNRTPSYAESMISSLPRRGMQLCPWNSYVKGVHAE